MPVRRRQNENGTLCIELLDDSGEPIEIAGAFLGHLAARDYSPNTLLAYAHDLQHLWRFLDARGLAWHAFRPMHALDLLDHLRATPARRRSKRLTLTGVTTARGVAAPCLAPATINRIIAAVSSFYEFAIVSGRFDQLNPIEKRPDPHLARTAERHRPFLDGISRHHPVRRSIRVRSAQRLPRPLDEDQVEALLQVLRSRRDRALIRLMLDGGLRPGEALSLHLADIAYGKRRLTVRHRTDHPKGARSKSRQERVVDLHEPVTLQAVSDYVMEERPQEAQSPFLFLVGGHGKRRLEPLSYAALVKLFRRACQRAGLDAPWITPHTLRHTHATRMWEGGMRELALQKRLGHASPESTRIYTRVSDPAMVADYRRALGLGSSDTDGGPV